MVQSAGQVFKPLGEMHVQLHSFGLADPGERA